MNPLLKLLAIMASVFLMGFFLEEMIDSSGLNNRKETFQPDSSIKFADTEGRNNS